MLCDVSVGDKSETRRPVGRPLLGSKQDVGLDQPPTAGGSSDGGTVPTVVTFKRKYQSANDSVDGGTHPHLVLAANAPPGHPHLFISVPRPGFQPHVRAWCLFLLACLLADRRRPG